MNSVRIDDRAWRKILKPVVKMGQRPRVAVGILTSNEKPKPGGTGRRKDKIPADSPTILEYAAWNEFGTKTIPPRPFIRKTADIQRKAWQKHMRNSVEKILDGKGTLKLYLNAIGQRAQADIRNGITQEKYFRDNAESTKIAKGTDGLDNTPLVDTNSLVRAINYVVEGL